MGRIGYEEKIRRRKSRKTNHAALRAENSKKSETTGKSLQRKLRGILANCGLTNTQLSDFSGLSTSKVFTFIKGYRGKLMLNSFIALVRAAGYRIRLEKVEDVADQYRSHRRVSLPPL